MIEEKDMLGVADKSAGPSAPVPNAGSGFQKYQHVERFGTDETEHIELGECYVFPKIDGTNASAWMHEGEMQFGSRTRTLSLDFDNQGFMAWAVTSPELRSYLEANPSHRLFGEWLVPHSIRTYKDEAWRNFYVFDVAVPSDSDRGHDYIPYEVYKPLLEAHGINYVPPVCIMRNADYEQLIEQLPQNVFLLKDGTGAGEGVVLKRYDYRNKYGRQTWAKLVTSEFKEKHAKAMGAPVKSGVAMVEEAIAEKYVTSALVEKEYAKIAAAGGWASRSIPRLLHCVYYAIVTEELWHAVKEHSNPKIDFKRLMHFVYGRTKARKPELF